MNKRRKANKNTLTKNEQTVSVKENVPTCRHPPTAKNMHIFFCKDEVENIYVGPDAHQVMATRQGHPSLLERIPYQDLEWGLVVSLCQGYQALVESLLV